MSYSEKPWEKSYFIGPFKLKKTMEPYPEINIYQWLKNSAEKHPNNVACIYLERELTYKELKLRTDKFATGLEKLGIKKGDYVATILPNCPEFIICDYAIMKLGAVHVPISVLHSSENIIHELNESGAETVICSYKRLERVNSVKGKTKLKNMIYTPVPIFPDYSLPEMEKISDDGYFLLNEIIEKSEPHTRTVEINPKEDLALLPFTGGTTGRPKGTMITHYNITCNIIQSIHWMLDKLKLGVIGKAATEICVPFFHALGHYSLHAGISWGLRIFIMDPRDMNRIAEVIKNKRPFMVIAVPTTYMILSKMDIPQMPSFFYSGAAALPTEVAESFEKMTKIPLSEGYGATEATAATHMNISALSAITGLMKKVKRGIGVPVVDTEVKIVSTETGKEVPFGERGEIWIRGPQIMKGYWPTPGKGLTKEGWLATGDIGIMDEDGYFQIVDRIKDMINISGNKVYSRELDDVLHEFKGVNMVGVIGVPDPQRPGSERVKAFIQIGEEYEGKITKEDIIKFCREKFPPYAVPKYIEFRKQLPLTPAMKIKKRELRDEEIAKMKEKGLIN
ncbi:MAG: AMP-binding protein [Promethearchaeota archaeon]